MTFEIWFYFVKDKFCRERRGTEQLLLRFSEPNQRFISLNPLSIRIPSNSSLCWLVTTTRERERENLDRVTQQCKENKGNDFDYGWMRPDLSRQVWHVLTHLLISGRSLPSPHITKHIGHALLWNDTDPALTSHISSSVFSVLISKQLFSRAWSWSVIFIGQVWYPRSSVKYLPRTGHIHLIPLSPSPC